MAIKPILFNTEMVRAILDGRKTCTRRIVRPPYFVDGDENDKRSLITLRTATKNSSLYRQIGQMPYPDAPYRMCDILYVRETWERFECRNCEGDERGICPKEPQKNVLDKHSCGCYMYRATDEICGDAKWHPSIHMPKEAARIWLRVTDVKVERLQDMTDEDCEKEGLENFCKKCSSIFSECDTCMNDGGIKMDFKELWNSTIKKPNIDRYGWDASPWVWVIEFERCEKPEGV